MRALLRIAALAGVAALLVRLGSTLPPPPGSSPAHLGAWLDEIGPQRAAIATGWSVSVALCAYLSVLALLAAAARVSGLPGLARASIVCTPRPLRHLVGVGVGVGLTIGAVGPVGAGTPVAPPRLVLVEPSPDAATTPDPSTAAPTLRAVDEEPTPAAPSTPAAPVTVTIAPGDHLWGVSAAVIGTHLGRPAHDEEVGAYLARLLAANPHRLVVPDNPDLVFPGQEFVLPPP